MRYYYELQTEDKGLLTMLDGHVMQFKHCNEDVEDAYLMDIVTGEAYPIVAILGDGETTVYVTEV